jgi:hypothetical protein
LAEHPDYYAGLVRRRVTAAPPLTEREQHELDLHLYICARCNFFYAELLEPRHPAAAAALRQDLRARLTADMVTPYLQDLAVAFQAGQPLDGFQRELWHFVQGDEEALGRFRLIEAALWLQGWT